MPKGIDYAEEPQGGGSDFLKLEDGESVTALLMDEPMLLSKHNIDDGSEYGQRFFCGTPEGLGCPVCDTPSDYKFVKDNPGTRQEGLFPLFVEARIKDGKSETVHAHMIFSGGWTVVGAFRDFRRAQEQFGEEWINVPIHITRAGERAQTKYTIVPREKLKIEAEGEVIDVEDIGLKMIAKEHLTAGFATEGDPFDGHPDEADEEDPFDAAVLREILIAHTEEAGFANEKARDTWLKAVKKVVIRGDADLPKAIQALEERIEERRAKAA